MVSPSFAECRRNRKVRLPGLSGESLAPKTSSGRQPRARFASSRDTTLGYFIATLEQRLLAVAIEELDRVVIEVGLISKTIGGRSLRTRKRTIFANNRPQADRRLSVRETISRIQPLCLRPIQGQPRRRLVDPLTQRLRRARMPDGHHPIRSWRRLRPGPAVASAMRNTRHVGPAVFRRDVGVGKSLPRQETESRTSLLRSGPTKALR